jgi:hypothetical protein
MLPVRAKGAEYPCRWDIVLVLMEQHQSPEGIAFTPLPCMGHAAVEEPMWSAHAYRRSVVHAVVKLPKPHIIEGTQYIGGSQPRQHPACSEVRALVAGVGGVQGCEHS